MPAISRPLLIALVAAVVALVGFYATQGARTASESGDAVAPVVPAEVEAPPSAAQPVDRADAPKREARAKADARPVEKRAAAVSGPAAVKRAIDRKQRVVLFFGTPRGADDQATADAVRAQRGRGTVVVLEPVEKLARYRDLIGGLGISQAPAVVIVGKDGAARLVEGYVDPATLAQEVADAR